MHQHDPMVHSGNGITLDYVTERVIRGSLWYYAGLSGPPVIFVATGAWMALTGAHVIGIIALCLGLLLLALPATMIMTGGVWLRIGDAGFSVRQGKTEQFRWNDIVQFSLVRVSHHAAYAGRWTTVEIGVTCRTDPNYRNLSRQRRRALARHSTPKPQYMIDPQCFGMSADQLLSLLEETRQKAVSSSQVRAETTAHDSEPKLP